MQPDYHVDLHTFSTLSMPFIFLDRVMYDDSIPCASKETADKLFEKTHGMVRAMGFTVLRERPPRIYIEKKLHRRLAPFCVLVWCVVCGGVVCCSVFVLHAITSVCSTSGATLNKLGIPSCTRVGSYGLCESSCEGLCSNFP